MGLACQTLSELSEPIELSGEAANDNSTKKDALAEAKNENEGGAIENSLVAEVQRNR